MEEMEQNYLNELNSIKDSHAHELSEQIQAQKQAISMVKSQKDSEITSLKQTHQKEECSLICQVERCQGA